MPNCAQIYDIHKIIPHLYDETGIHDPFHDLAIVKIRSKDNLMPTSRALLLFSNIMDVKLLFFVTCEIGLGNAFISINELFHLIIDFLNIFSYIQHSFDGEFHRSGSKNKACCKMDKKG